MRRTVSFNALVSDKLQKKGKRYRQSYLLAYINDHGLTVEDALKHTIEDMGVKAFAELCDVYPSEINEFCSGKRNPKPEKLDVYLKPFALKIKLVVEKLKVA